MKIWLDFINTPQVSFFIPFIREFEQQGHEILITCRDSGNTIGLLEQHNLPYHVVGKRVGKGSFDKGRLFIQRLFQLYSFIRKNRPDVAASQSSFYQPFVANLLGIPSMYTNDNEHAKGNLLSFLFATRVVLPEALEKEAFTKKWPLKSKVSYYPSVKESIYLSQQPELVAALSREKNTIYFRPEPWSAQYYKGPVNFFDEILLKLSEEHNVIVLPRDKNQRAHYQQDKFEALTVPDGPLKLADIVANCLLFIGAGGSMTRELAVLGIPVISIYQAELLSVDQYLVDRGLLKVDPRINYEQIKSILASKNGAAKDHAVLEEGQASYSLIHKTINNLIHD